MATIYDLEQQAKIIEQQQEIIEKLKQENVFYIPQIITIVDYFRENLPDEHAAPNTIYEMVIGKFEDQSETIKTQQEIIDRQRNALQLLLNAIWIHINSGGSDEQLQDAYRVVSSASTMTGTTEE